MHLLEDLHAVIQPGPDAQSAAVPRDALLISSLRPTAPFVLLNVSMGDQAILSTSACGCPLEDLGWRKHIRAVRSHEKLTAGGMTFLDSAVVRVLEEVLPARFGGAPTDYQLVEEAQDGRPSLRLLVHPSVGPLEEGVVAETFLRAISHGPGPERVMSLFWQEAGLLSVERRPPVVTGAGKILHLHAERSGSP